MAQEIMTLIREKKMPLVIDKHDNDILVDIDMPVESMSLILRAGGAYGLPGSAQVSVEMYK